MDARLHRHLSSYFEYSNHGVEVVSEGLEEMKFGEYLVLSRAITRQQLLTALMFQDRHPGLRLGQCVATLGFAGLEHVESLLEQWQGLNTVEVG